MTNEQKTEVMEAVEMKEETNKQEQSRKERVLGYFKRNKKQCGVIAGALVLVVAGGGLAIATGNINPVDTLTGVNNNSTTSSAHSTTKANDAKNTSATDADTQATEGDKSAEATSTDGSSNVDTSNSDTNANGNSGTSTATNSASSSQASTSAHTHSWTPVYKTVHHDAETATQPIYSIRERSICNTCGEDITGNVIAHLKANRDCAGTHGKAESYVSGYQTVTTKQAYDEQVVDHYTCSCGATK